MKLIGFIILSAVSILLLTDAKKLTSETIKEVKQAGYILVDTSKNVSRGRISKHFQSFLARANTGSCKFKDKAEKETSRIPKFINVAVLEDPTKEKECMKITHLFTVLKQCTECNNHNTHGIIYRLSKQSKVIGFRKR